MIWGMMKRNGMHLSGPGPITQSSDLTPDQISRGAKVGPATPDGLYLCSARERLNVANFLFGTIQDEVKSELDDDAKVLGNNIGGLVDNLTKITTHVPNENVNAFARDIVQVDDDDEGWSHTVDANAVNPNNILFWNGPSAPTPGPYGYHEPLIYNKPRYDAVRISRWKQVQLTGTFDGTVTYNNAPVPGATVMLGSDKISGTDANGYFTISNVPYGPYLAQAQKVQQDGELLSAMQPVDLESPKQTINGHVDNDTVWCVFTMQNLLTQAYANAMDVWVSGLDCLDI